MNREQFHVAGVELRTAEAGKARTISGYAATYNSRSQKLGSNPKFIETITPGAFRSVLAKKPDVRMLVQHDPNFILGRTKSGTLKLGEDARGLKFECELPDTTYARDAYIAIKRGDMNQCSFGFSLEKGDDDWTEGEDENRARCLIRTIRNVSELSDVSVVTYPAYADTTVEARTGARKFFIPTPPAILRPSTVDTSAVLDAAFTKAFSREIDRKAYEEFAAELGV